MIPLKLVIIFSVSAFVVVGGTLGSMLAPHSAATGNQFLPFSALNEIPTGAGNLVIRTFASEPAEPSPASPLPQDNPSGSKVIDTNDTKTATANNQPSMASQNATAGSSSNALDNATKVNSNSTGTIAKSSSGSSNSTLTLPANATAPIIVVPNEAALEARNASGTVAIFSGIQAVDVHDGSFAATCLPSSGSLFPIGKTVVLCKAVNSRGIEADANFTITVQDTVPPSIAPLKNITAKSTGNLTKVSLETPVVSDSVDSSPAISSDTPSDGFPPGKTLVTCTATYKAGNSANAVQLVTITDAPPLVHHSPTEVNVAITGPQFVDGQKTFVSTASTLTLSPLNSSSVSGTFYRYYPVGTAAPKFVPGSSVAINGTDGTYTLEYQGVGNDGKAGSIQAMTIVLDNAAPESIISIGNGASIAAGDYLNITTSDTLGGSGIAKSATSGIYHSIDGNQQYSFSNSRTALISTSNLTSGVHVIAFYGVDNLGNQEHVQNLSFTVYDCSTLPLNGIKGVVFGDSILTDTQGGIPSFSARAPALDVRMHDIASKGFNLIRVPFYWEAYSKNPSAFLTEMSAVASTAQSSKLCVIFDNHQSNTGGKFGGGGFPLELTKNYASPRLFWLDYYGNLITVGGKSSWDLQAAMMRDVIKAVDRYHSVYGYEILNGPYIFAVSEYSQLGQLQTFIASKMREDTTKTIFFDKAEPEYNTPLYTDFTLDPLTIPSGVTNIVFAPHSYDEETPANLADYVRLAASWKVPMLIGEWGQTTQSGTQNYIDAFNEQSIGWIRWSYDPFDSTYNLMDAYYQPTQNLTYLLNALS